MKPTRIAIIGTGSVGAATAYALIMKNITAEIMLVDCDETRCTGELLDLADTLPLSSVTRIVGGNLKTAAQSDIVIIAVGKRQLPGQSREGLLHDNAQIIKTLITDMKPFKKETIIIAVTNPVDAMAAVIHKASGLPHAQVFGTGTFLDTQRTAYNLGAHFNVAAESIQAMVIGEHGPSACIPWSWARLNGLPLPTISEETKRSILDRVHNQAELIIQKKQASYYGIAACVAELCTIIMLDQRKIVPVSCFYDPKQIYISVPIVLGIEGIHQYMELNLRDDEKKLFAASCTAVAKQLKMII